MLILILADYDYDRTGYATIVALGGLVISMNILNRDLDDPFVYPKDFHASSYALGKQRPLTIREAWTSGPNIDFLCLTVDFGGVLRRRLAERGVRAYTVAPAAGGAENEPGAAPHSSKAAAVAPLAAAGHSG